MPVRGGTEEDYAWRFSLQEAEREARRHAFSSLEDLVAFLGAELEQTESERVRDNQP